MDAERAKQALADSRAKEASEIPVRIDTCDSTCFLSEGQHL
jgi:hypothetical protein